MSDWKERAALLGILLLAFALRVYNIEGQSIWGDEAFSIYTAKQDIAYIFGAGTDVHPPLYHLFLHCWMQLAGESPLAVRFLSLMWGMLIVAAGYALAKRLMADGGRRTADQTAIHRPSSAVPFSVAFLLAISPFQIFYAQETRMYAQVAALSALSLVFFVRWLESGDWRRGTGWFVTTLFAIYTQYFAFFILAAENLWLAAHQSKIKNQQFQILFWVTAHVLLALLYLPWLVAQASDLSSRANARASAFSPQGAWEVISKTFTALFVGSTLDGPAQSIGALAMLLFAVVGWFAYRRARLAMLLALSIGVPLLGAILISPLLPYFRERFLLLASAPFVMLMACGLAATAAILLRIMHHTSHSSQLTARIQILLISLISLISLFALSSYWSNPQFRKGEYDLAIAAIRAHAQPSDAVVIYSPIQDALYDYYRINELPTYQLPKADLVYIAAHHARAWLILYGDPAVYDPTHSAEKFFSARGFKSFYQSYRDGALARYDFTQSDAVVERKQLQFGDSIRLTGYALPSVVARGETLAVALQWQTSAPLAENYTVFVHLLSADGHVVAQMDTQPVGGTRPTTTWQVGETIRDHIGVSVPRDLPVGRYQIEIGLYLLQTLKRLEIRDWGDLRVQNDALMLGDVELR